MFGFVVYFSVIHYICKDNATNTRYTSPFSKRRDICFYTRKALWLYICHYYVGVFQRRSSELCVSCGSGGSIKRKIAIASSVAAVGVAGVSFYVFSNSSLAASLPSILILAACPAMCAAMGGAMWLSGKLSRRKQSSDPQSCCTMHQNYENHGERVAEEKTGEAAAAPSPRSRKDKGEISIED